MVCDRVYYRSTAQMIFFVGYMVGSIVFGILADKYLFSLRISVLTSEL